MAACSTQVDEEDKVYYRWDGATVLCAAGIDDVAGNDLSGILRGLERARDEGSVVQVYGHRPGGTVPIETIEAIVARARELDLPALTYPELIDGPARAGYALSFDDAHVDEWYELRGLLAEYEAHVTFFVTRYDLLDADRRRRLTELAQLGHAIEAHSLRHQRAPSYVEEHGLDAYLADEALPSIDLLRADGFTPRVYAYPFGARTSELDAALLQHVEMLRSVTFTFGGPLISDPCP